MRCRTRSRDGRWRRNSFARELLSQRITARRVARNRRRISSRNSATSKKKPTKRYSGSSCSKNPEWFQRSDSPQSSKKPNELVAITVASINTATEARGDSISSALPTFRLPHFNEPSPTSSSTGRSSPASSASSSRSSARSRSSRCRSRSIRRSRRRPMQVTANYPGANAKVVAETVATPIEQQVNGVENMLYMSSQSTSDGNMALTITFKLGTNLDDRAGARAEPRGHRHARRCRPTCSASASRRRSSRPTSRWSCISFRPTARSTRSSRAITRCSRFATSSRGSTASATSTFSARANTRCASGSIPTSSPRAV